MKPAGKALPIIIEEVADAYGLTSADLTGPSRSRSVVRARKVAMGVARELTDASWVEIGRAFGDRDHSTAVQAVREVLTNEVVQAELAQAIAICLAALEAPSEPHRGEWAMTCGACGAKFP